MSDNESYAALQAERDALRARVKDLERELEQLRRSSLGRTVCLYRDLLDHASDCLWRLDAEWRFIYVSRAAKQMAGYQPDELVGRSFEVVLTKEAAEQARSAIEQRLDKGATDEGITLVLAHRRKDGSEFAGELRGVPIFNDAGELIALEGSTRDVTQREQIQAALRQSERRYRHLYERSPAVNVTITAEGRIVDCNNTLPLLLELDREQTIGLSVLDLVVPEHLPRVRNALANLSAGAEQPDLEVNVFGANGEVRSMIIAPGYADTGVKGRKDLFLVTALDITLRKRAEELLKETNLELERRVATRTAELEEMNARLQQEVADREFAESQLRNSEANFRALAENASDAMLIGDTEGRHIFANPRASKLLGYSLAELLGTTVQDIVHPEDLPRVLSRYKLRLKGKLPSKPYEAKLVRKDGIDVSVELTGSRTSWRGRLANLAIIRDVSERKRAETANRILRDSFEQSRDGILISGSQGTVTFVNQALCDSLGSKPSKLIGRNHDEAIVLDARTKEILDSSLEQRPSWSGRVELLNAPDRPRTVDLTRLLILDEDGQRIAMVDTYRDIQARQQLEALQQTIEEVAGADKTDEHLLRRIMARLPQLVGSAAWVLYVNAPEAGELRGVTGDEAGRRFLEAFPRIAISESPAAQAATQGELLCTADMLSDPMYVSDPVLSSFLPVLGQMNLRAGCGVPIRRGGHVLGLLLVADCRVRDFSAEEIGILRALAAQLALVIRPETPSDTTGSHDAAQAARKTAAIVAESHAMRGMLAAANRIAKTDLPAIILGPTGAGKGHLARYIHSISARAESPFLSVNCACLDGDLILSELFGHERGAFTGAMRRQKGCFELANGGTLLLDEAVELPPDAQAKLLQVVETQQFRRLGGQESILTDVRLLCVTNADIRDCIRNGKFRQDLYYRLNAAELVVPPLRDRPEDILPLAEDFLCTQAVTQGRPAPILTNDAMRRLCEYDWPGNVRELQNVLLQAWSFGRNEIRAADLHFSPVRGPESEEATPRDDETREREVILALLDKHQWNRSKTAEEMGIHRNTLRERMRKLGISE